MTEDEIEIYRAKCRAEVAAKNPGREFEILFGTENKKPLFVALWIDGKGCLL